MSPSAILRAWEPESPVDHRLVIVDDFYDDPDRIRKDALAMEYPVTGHFPGRNTVNHGVEDAFQSVLQAIRLPIVVNPRWRDITFFRLTRGRDDSSADIHVDHSGWAGVCYLNPSPPTRGGTSFFRHRLTGLTHWPTVDEVQLLVAQGLLPGQTLDSPSELDRFFAGEGRNRERWEEVMHVPSRYNRAVFYNAHQFHTIADWRSFGDTDQEARLCRLFFFDIKPGGPVKPIIPAGEPQHSQG